MRNNTLKYSHYKKYIQCEQDGRPEGAAPDATVAVIIYNSGDAILDLIASLKNQSLQSFEIVIINNGKIETDVIETIKTEPVQYIENTFNSLSFGRNMAALHARGEIIIYLDDDCTADEHLVKNHLNLYADDTVLGIQGKGMAYKHPFYCTFQSHYDLGPDILPAVYSFEGNISIRKNALFEAGGFDPKYFGCEGLKLSYNLSMIHKRNDVIRYNPKAVIYHDFAKGLIDYLEKCYRHVKMRKAIEKEFPPIISFARSFGPYPQGSPPELNFIERICQKCIGKLGQLAETLAGIS